MKITKTRLKQLIKEELQKNLLEDDGAQQKVIMYNKGSYPGTWDADFSDGQDLPAFGQMILDLVAKGKNDFAEPGGLELALKQHEKGVQGGMQRWDSDVFGHYYDIDLEKVIVAWGEMSGYVVQKAPDHEETAGWGF